LAVLGEIGVCSSLGDTGLNFGKVGEKIGGSLGDDGVCPRELEDRPNAGEDGEY